MARRTHRHDLRHRGQVPDNQLGVGDNGTITKYIAAHNKSAAAHPAGVSPSAAEKVYAHTTFR